jgi:DnaJ-class molecular chaperone
MFMKKAREVSTDMTCPACDGTGFQKVKQPTEPGRRIYPAPCKECLGKGQIKKPQSGGV